MDDDDVDGMEPGRPSDHLPDVRRIKALARGGATVDDLTDEDRAKLRRAVEDGRDGEMAGAVGALLLKADVARSGMVDATTGEGEAYRRAMLEAAESAEEAGQPLLAADYRTRAVRGPQ